MAVATGVARKQAGKKKKVKGYKKLKKTLTRVVASVSIIAALAGFAKVDSWAEKTFNELNAMPYSYTQSSKEITAQSLNSFTPYVIWQGNVTVQKLLNLQNEMGYKFDSIIVANSGINKNGQLQMHDTPPTKDEITEMQSHGIKMKLMVTDFELDGSQDAVKTILASDVKIKESAINIATQTQMMGYNAVNIDFENWTNLNPNSFNSFVEELSKQLKARGLTCSFSVYPKRSDAENSFLDYNKLTEYGEVVVMLYNEHYTGSKPGPVASIQFKEDVLRYIYKDVKDLSRIKIADPNYALVWGVPIEIDGKTITANGSTVSVETANKIAAKYKTEVKWDAQKGTNFAEFKANGRSAQIYIADHAAARETQKIISRLAKEYGKLELATGVWDGGSLLGGSASDKAFIQTKREMLNVIDDAQKVKAIKKVEDTMKNNSLTLKERIELDLAERYLGAREKVKEESKEAANKYVVEPIKKEVESTKTKINEKISMLLRF